MWSYYARPDESAPSAEVRRLVHCGKRTGSTQTEKGRKGKISETTVSGLKVLDTRYQVRCTEYVGITGQAKSEKAMTGQVVTGKALTGQAV